MGPRYPTLFRSPCTPIDTPHPSPVLIHSRSAHIHHTKLPEHSARTHSHVFTHYVSSSHAHAPFTPELNPYKSLLTTCIQNSLTTPRSYTPNSSNTPLTFCAPSFAYLLLSHPLLYGNPSIVSAHSSRPFLGHLSISLLLLAHAPHTHPTLHAFSPPAPLLSRPKSISSEK